VETHEDARDNRLANARSKQAPSQWPLIAACALASALTLAAVLFRLWQPRPVPLDLQDFAPADTRVVYVVNHHQFRGSTAYRELEEMLPEAVPVINGIAGQFMPPRQVERSMLLGNWRDGRLDATYVLQTYYDINIDNVLLNLGVQVEDKMEWNGRTCYRYRRPLREGTPPRPRGLCLMDATTLVESSPEVSLDLALRRKPVEFSPQLLDAMTRVDLSQGVALVSDVSGLAVLRALNVPASRDKSLEGIENAAMQVVFNEARSRISIAGGLKCRDEQAAAAIRTLVLTATEEGEKSLPEQVPVDVREALRATWQQDMSANVVGALALDVDQFAGLVHAVKKQPARPR
jgi:hypothetical protein